MVSSHGNPIATRPLPQSEIKANNRLVIKGKMMVKSPFKNTLFTVRVAFTALVRIPMFKGGKNFWPLTFLAFLKFHLDMELWCF